MIKKLAYVGLSVILLDSILIPTSIVEAVSTTSSTIEQTKSNDVGLESTVSTSTTNQTTTRTTNESSNSNNHSSSTNENSVEQNSGKQKDANEQKTTNTELKQPIKQIFPDQNLAKRVAETFGKTVNDEITIQQIMNFNGVFSTDKVSDNYPDLEIQNIEGIQYFVNAQEISLSRINGSKQKNKIHDLSPFAHAKFNNLRTLILDNNQITDVSPLSNLDSLTELGLNDNNITNITGISKLENLKKLSLQNNKVESIPEESRLKNLEELYAANNDFTNLAGLNESRNLRLLFIENSTRLRDLSPIQPANLQQVSVLNDPIGSLDIFSQSNHLKVLFASNTGISDLQPLKNKQLETLLIEDNHIRDLSPLHDSNSSMRWFAGRNQTITNSNILSYKLNQSFSINNDDIAIFMPDKDLITNIFIDNISDYGKVVKERWSSRWQIQWNLSQAPKNGSSVTFHWDMPYKIMRNNHNNIFPNINNSLAQNFTGEVIQPVKLIGLLTLESIPSTINFGSGIKLSVDPLFLKGSNTGSLVVSDTRVDSQKKKGWQLSLKENKALINKNIELTYKNRKAQTIAINEKNQPIEYNLANYPETDNISNNWLNAESGLFLTIPPEAQKIGHYEGSLIWTLQDTPNAR